METKRMINWFDKRSTTEKSLLAAAAVTVLATGVGVPLYLRNRSNSGPSGAEQTVFSALTPPPASPAPVRRPPPPIPAGYLLGLRGKAPQAPEPAPADSPAPVRRPPIPAGLQPEPAQTPAPAPEPSLSSLIKQTQLRPVSAEQRRRLQEAKQKDEDLFQAKEGALALQIKEGRQLKPVDQAKRAAAKAARQAELAAEDRERKLAAGDVGTLFQGMQKLTNIPQPRRRSSFGRRFLSIPPPLLTLSDEEVSLLQTFFGELHNAKFELKSDLKQRLVGVTDQNITIMDTHLVQLMYDILLALSPNKDEVEKNSTNVRGLYDIWESELKPFDLDEDGWESLESLFHILHYTDYMNDKIQFEKTEQMFHLVRTALLEYLEAMGATEAVASAKAVYSPMALLAIYDELYK